MRKSWLMVCVVLLLASPALAQEKIESQWNCPKPSEQHSIDVGDKPNHAYVVNKTTCTPAKSSLNEKEGVGTQFMEIAGNWVSWHGIFVTTTDSGDKIFFHYANSGKAVMKDGQFVSGNDKWTVAGGTGKYASAKGEGTCAGKGDGNGGATWDCTGTYTTK
jgi:hypothetical protein